MPLRMRTVCEAKSATSCTNSRVVDDASRLAGGLLRRGRSKLKTRLVCQGVVGAAASLPRTPLKRELACDVVMAS